MNKSEFYYLGKMAQMCQKAAKRQRPPFYVEECLRQMRQSVPQAVQYCDRFRDLLGDEERSQFEDIRNEIKIARRELKEDFTSYKYTTTPEYQERAFHEGFQYGKMGHHFLTNISLWVLVSVGFLIWSDQLHPREWTLTQLLWPEEWHLRAWTPTQIFCNAVRHDRMDVVEFALRHVSNPDEYMQAATDSIQSAAMLDFLMEKGYTCTSDFLFENQHDVDFFKVFLKHGGDPGIEHHGLPFPFLTTHVGILSLCLEADPERVYVNSNGQGLLEYYLANRPKELGLIKRIMDTDPKLDVLATNGKPMVLLVQDNLELLPFFLEKKVFPPVTDTNKNFVADFLGSHQDDVEYFRAFLNSGGDPGIEYQDTPFPFQTSNVEILSLCLETEAGRNCVDSKGRGLVEHYLVMRPEDVEFIKRIMDTDLELDVPAANGKPLIYLVLDKPGLLRFFVEKKVFPPVFDENQDFVLNTYPNEASARLLCEAGYDIHAKNADGNTPLHLAKTGALRRVLVQNGADFMAENNDGLTPLEYQLRGAGTLADRIAEQLERDATMRERLGTFNPERLAARRAAGMSDEAIASMERLMGTRSRANARTNLDRMMEQFNEHVGFINEYVDLKCDVLTVFRRMIANRQNVLPVFCSSRLDLTGLDESGNTFLQTLVQKMQEETIRMMEDTSNQIEALDESANDYENQKKRILSRAVETRTTIERYYITTIVKLAEGGSDINQQNRDGETLLHFSVRMYLPIVTNVLVKGIRAQVNIENNDGIRPLHLACANTLLHIGFVTSSEVSDLETVKCLVSNGADINAKTHDGRTAIFFAIMADHCDVVEFLLENGAKEVPWKDCYPADFATSDEMRETLAAKRFEMQGDQDSELLYHFRKFRALDANLPDNVDLILSEEEDEVTSSVDEPEAVDELEPVDEAVEDALAEALEAVE